MTTMKQAGIKPDNTGYIHAFDQLEAGQNILYYDHTALKWSPARVMHVGTNVVQMVALEGDLDGVVWCEDIARLSDPDNYLRYLGNDS